MDSKNTRRRRNENFTLHPSHSGTIGMVPFHETKLRASFIRKLWGEQNNPSTYFYWCIIWKKKLIYFERKHSFRPQHLKNISLYVCLLIGLSFFSATIELGGLPRLFPCPLLLDMVQERDRGNRVPRKREKAGWLRGGKPQSTQMIERRDVCKTGETCRKTNLNYQN